MKARIAVLAGDGVGPEVIAEAERCLRAVAQLFGHTFELIPAPFGGAAIDAGAEPLPRATLQLCLAADAVLLGAVGGPKWSAPGLMCAPNRACCDCAANLACTQTCAPCACTLLCLTHRL